MAAEIRDPHTYLTQFNLCKLILRKLTMTMPCRDAVHTRPSVEMQRQGWVGALEMRADSIGKGISTTL
jgi:hypothetical protein